MEFDFEPENDFIQSDEIPAEEISFDDIIDDNLFDFGNYVPPPPQTLVYVSNPVDWKMTVLKDIISTNAELFQVIEELQCIYSPTVTRLNDASEFLKKDQHLQLIQAAIIASTYSSDTQIFEAANSLFEVSFLQNGVDEASMIAVKMLTRKLLDEFNEESKLFRSIIIYPFWLRLLVDCYTFHNNETAGRTQTIHDLKQRILPMIDDLPDKRRKEVFDAMLDETGTVPYLDESDEKESELKQMFLFLHAAITAPVISYCFYNTHYDKNLLKEFRNFLGLLKQVIEPALLGYPSFYSRLPSLSTLMENGIDQVNFSRSYKKQLREIDNPRKKRKYEKSGKYSKSRKDIYKNIQSDKDE